MLGIPTSRYLWEQKQVVPILKVDKGLADERDGVQLMKPIDTLDRLLERANRHRVFGTKMRSVIKDADKDGVAAIADQQFEYGGGSPRPGSSRSWSPRSASTARTRRRPRACSGTRCSRASRRCPTTRRSC